MNYTNEMIEKAKKAASAEELPEMAKAEGVELTALRHEAEGLNAKHTDLTENIIREELLSDVAGGEGKYGPGGTLPWNSPLCERAAMRAEIFGGQFQGCDLYDQTTKDLVKSLCAEFKKYVNTEESFNLNMAQHIYLQIASIVSVFSMSIVADAGWRIFTRAFYEIFSY